MNETTNMICPKCGTIRRVENGQIVCPVCDQGAKHTRNPTRQYILESAIKCVCGDREEDYGSPENNFSLIASLWEPYIRSKCASPNADITINPEDVAVMMALPKIARIATGHGKADNWVDGCGYLACGGEVEVNAGE